MGPRRFALLLAVLALVALNLGAGAAPASTLENGGLWFTHGPRGGRALALEVSPSFATDGIALSGEWLTSFRSTESGLGIVRSGDGGQNWAVSDAGTGGVDYASAVHDFAFSPQFSSDQTAFAATWGGLFKSVDGGMHWSWLEEAYSGPPGAYTTIAVAPDFGTSGQVLAGDTGGLLRSNDGGDSWQRLDDVGAAADIAYGPAAGAVTVVFASDGMSVYRSEDAALSWTHVLTAPVRSLALSPAFSSDETVFAAGGAHVYISEDGGTTWISNTVDVDVTMINILAISPQFATDSTLFLGAANGLFYSQNGGATWTSITAYEGQPVRSLAISPQWPQHAVLLVGTDAGVYRLLGTNTSGANVRQPATGFVPLSASPLAWSEEAGLLLTATSNHGVYGSEDGGKQWQPMGLQASSSYYSFSDVAISPAYNDDGTLFAAWLSGTGIGGTVYRSIDRGATWDYVYSTDYVGDLAISPDYENDATVFATSGDNGLVRSTNGGDDWEEVGDWPGGGAHGIALYVALPPDYPSNEMLFVGGARGFWRLPPGETTWQPSLSGISNQHSVVSLAVSPEFANDNMLLALANGPAPGPGLPSFAVYRSLDGGVNWHYSGYGLPDTTLFDVTFSPAFAADDTAYLTTADGELYRSLDGGEHWESLGSADGAPQLFDVLVRDDGAIFVGSQSGVWQFVADPFRTALPLFFGDAIAQ